jgi:hypothetical protein
MYQPTFSLAPVLGEEAHEGEGRAAGVLRPAAPEEGGINDEMAPPLARRGAAEEGGLVVRQADEDLEEDLVREGDRHGRRHLFHRSSFDTYFFHRSGIARLYVYAIVGDVRLD